jgi:rRNA maturation RNase YbeY
LAFKGEVPPKASHYVADVASGFSRTDAAPGFSRTRYLGDVVIAAGVARRQAREAGHSLRTELRVLALHGLLHLLGYDHHDRNAAARMASAERRLLRKGRLSLGLVDRADRQVRS